MARQKGARKRSLQVVNEHVEPLFNAASAAVGINQSFFEFAHLLFEAFLKRYTEVRTLENESGIQSFQANGVRQGPIGRYRRYHLSPEGP